ncbi:hypothetical protein LSAT2_025413 [Lamellibrachia satsuma]|nr:hypothetical protein LSAT2_025413 [Lamellibrachia satsuma]
MSEREPDNSLPPSDKAAGQNVMEGIHQKSYSEAVIEGIRGCGLQFLVGADVGYRAHATASRGKKSVLDGGAVGHSFSPEKPQLHATGVRQLKCPANRHQIELLLVSGKCCDEGRSFISEIPDSPAAQSFSQIIHKIRSYCEGKGTAKVEGETGEDLQT